MLGTREGDFNGERWYITFGSGEYFQCLPDAKLLARLAPTVYRMPCQGLGPQVKGMMLPDT